MVYALRKAAFQNISFVDVKGLLKPLGANEEEYSIEIGNKVITEVKLEIVCPPDRVDEAIKIVLTNGRTGRPNAGWVYVSDIEATHEIGEPNDV